MDINNHFLFAKHAPAENSKGRQGYNKDWQAEQRHKRVIDGHRRATVGRKLLPLDFRSAKGIRPQDCFAFQSAAESFHVYVLVRSTNQESLKYIGQKGYAPKAIDCKPKTAEKDFTAQGNKIMTKAAGLVVNPFIAGLEAFKSSDKFTKAKEEWRHFQQCWYPAELENQVFSRRGKDKGFYAVDSFKGSDKYGCLMVSAQNIPTHFDRFNLSLPECQEWKNRHMSYIHGDYDLYACIDPDDPNAPPTKTTIFNVTNYQSKDVDNIKMFVNGWIGADVIQHGEQFHLFHQDDTVYAFAPAGGMFILDNGKSRTLADLFKMVLGVDA